MNTGVYEILNTVNGKRYIGSTVKFSKRFGQHRRALLRGKHHSPAFQRAWDKYGEGAFQFNILMLCEKDRDMLQMIEQHYFDTLKPEYNCALVAGSSLGTKRTQESKDKLKGNTHGLGHKHTQETKDKIAEANRGRENTRETIKNMSEAQRGKKASQETKDKMAETRRGTKYPPEFGAAISARMKGNTNTLGRKFPVEFGAAVSAGLRGKKRPDVSARMKGNTQALGYKHTQDAKEKISRSKIRVNAFNRLMVAQGAFA